MYHNIKESFKLLKQIKNPGFEIDRLDLYNLSLHVGERDFQMLVTDTSNNHVMLVEDYIFPKIKSPVKTLNILQKIFDDHHLLMAGFWDSISVAWKNKKFSFVPKNLFSDNMLSGYLRINADYSPKSDIAFINLHKRGNYYTVFAGEKEIANFIHNSYPSIHVKHFHQSEVLIEGLLRINNHQTPKIILFADRFFMHIAIFKVGLLQFYNQFPIHNFEDYTRYIDMAAKELQIELNEQPVTFYGYMGKNTPHYEALNQFINTLEPGRRPKGMRFNFVFDELSDHQYFDLFSIYLANSQT